MDTEQLQKFLEENKAEFESHLRQKVIDSLTQRIAWDLPNLIQAQVVKFYETELAPEVNQYLTDNKQAVMKVVMAAALEASDEVAKSMVERVKETMDKNSYQRNAVFKALFGIH